MGDTLLTILISLLVFGFLIFIHEFGHYITARIFKVTITEFSIGMGPKLVYYDSKKTGIRYSLAMLPIGGFVAMAGEDGDVTTGEDGQTKSIDDPNAFCKKPAWQRFIITSAGAFVNIVFGFLAMFIIVGSIKIGGTTVAIFTPAEELMTHGEIDLSSRSEGALLPGDVILAVEGNRVEIADEISYHIMRYGNDPVDILVFRDGVEITVADVVFPKMSSQEQVFGVMDFKVYEKEKDFLSFFSMTFRKTGLVLRMCYESIYDLITGRYSVAAVSGPVGISSAIGDAMEGGQFLPVLNLVVIISINLGFMNLLPIPALDGGRMLTIFIEMVTKKKLPPKVEATINAVGLMILLGLSVIILFKDIFTLF